MLKTIETQSDVKLDEPTQLPKPRWTLVTIFREELHVPEIALLSEVAFGEHWLRPEEDTTQTYHPSE
ncbi:MAG: hypothetical protein OXI63_16820 [Candidatus Poribacteria bacterium]|nr:hypothetical protein [Candidatus Poribacteria bacterium]